ncbi:HAD family hydrolase [Petrocella sp. FN5]|uniref:HAD family hydrolase n=1 Tax=Petrocella sp. FN5 TaxID=3032002 RepID=UPI0023DC8CB4|nr:HAD-IB family hydrolase [Petrocella sp. FN5]MDF1617698.1 HAD-IB family hydrolase [Petrocella sp. FN5]
MGKIAAFFDIDGTLYREGMITAIFKKMIKSDIISSEVWYKELREKYNRWDKRIGNYDDYLVRMAEIYIEAIRGLHRTQVEFIASKVIEQNGDRVYTYTRDRIKWHKNQGHQIITISGSPFELVREISEKFKFDHYVGSVYEMDDEHYYTGEVRPMWDSQNKKVALKHLVSEYDIDLSQSYAYGDTAGDFEMLKSVGHPVAMNPTKELLQKIDKDLTVIEKIKIVVERKDMIYHLTPDCIHRGENKT